MGMRVGLALRLLRMLLTVVALLLVQPLVAGAQVPCSGNAGGLNERRYSASPLQVAVGPAGINASSFDQGSVVITQQVQVIVELMQQSHFVSLCLHADYTPVGTARAIPAGDMEWRRLSPDPMSDFAPVSRNVQSPVLAQQAQGTLIATFEFRVRVRWETYVPGSYSSGLYWTAYRNQGL
jgi:hypothetical protein